MRPKCLTAERAAKLLKHLADLVKQTGMPLRLTSRDERDRLPQLSCPMENFAPDYAAFEKGPFFGVQRTGNVSYLFGQFSIYTIADSDWWNSLTRNRKMTINRWIQEQINKGLGQ